MQVLLAADKLVADSSAGPADSLKAGRMLPEKEHPLHGGREAGVCLRQLLSYIS